MIKSNAFMLGLLGLTTAGRLLTADNNLDNVDAYENDSELIDDFGHFLDSSEGFSNVADRKCNVNNWWVSCDGSDEEDDTAAPRCFIDPIFADD